MKEHKVFSMSFKNLNMRGERIQVVCQLHHRNHIQSMGQGPLLDLLFQVHEETQHQDCIEACGYRSPTWLFFRELKAVIDAKVVIGESAVPAAPIFESAGRPSKPFWGPQQGNRVILWENLGAGEKEECLKVLQKEANWAIWCKANPKDKGEQAFREHSRCMFTGRCKEQTHDNQSVFNSNS